MQRWEYQVISMRDGHYTRTLNELGSEGWELVGSRPDVHDTPAAPERSGGLPMPRALGRLEDAAAMVSRLDRGRRAARVRARRHGDDAALGAAPPARRRLRRPSIEG